jgi:hypothetical protein
MSAEVVRFPGGGEPPSADDDPMLRPVPFWYSLAREEQAPQEFAEDAGRMLQLYTKFTMRERHLLNQVIEAFAVSLGERSRTRHFETVRRIWR